MQVEFLNSFSKDVTKLKDKRVKNDVIDLITELKTVASLSEMSNIKKLKGTTHYYRIRVGDYRVGFEMKDQTITLMRILSRKDIYKYFP